MSATCLTKLFFIGKYRDTTRHIYLFICGKCHRECRDMFVRGKISHPGTKPYQTLHTVALPPDFAPIRTISLKKSQKALQTLTIIDLMHPKPFPVTRNAGMPGFRPIFATIRPSPDLLRSSQAPLAMGIVVDSCPAVQEKSPFSRFHNLPQHAEPSSRPTNAHKACHSHESALIMQGAW